MDLRSHLAALKQLGDVVHEAVDVLALAAGCEDLRVCACDVQVEDYLAFPGFRKESDGLFVELVSVDIELERGDAVVIIYDVLEYPVRPFCIEVELLVEEYDTIDFIGEKVSQLRAYPA
jgi:hypothetical protein